MGRAKLTIVSKSGKEATVTLLAPGDFFGEECMGGPDELRTTSATAIRVLLGAQDRFQGAYPCLHEENAFPDLFAQFLALRSTRTQAELIDQLFNNSERRLARTLLLMADYGNALGPETLIPSSRAASVIIGVWFRRHAKTEQA
jgi:CRP/FNR family transcriptional regulator, cyclic AMP receptor protein